MIQISPCLSVIGTFERANKSAKLVCEVVMTPFQAQRKADKFVVFFSLGIANDYSFLCQHMIHICSRGVAFYLC